MKTEILEEEEVIKEGRAKLQRGIGTVRGRLTLTNRRLIFEPKEIHYESDVVVIKFSHIVALRKKWTMYSNRVPVFPSTLSVETRNRKEYRFILFRRTSWAKKIDARKRS